MKILLKLKQGDKFVLPGARRESDGVTPKSLVGITVKSLVKEQDGTLVQELAVTIVNAALGTIAIPIDASTWPVGDLICDIKESGSGDVRHTETYIFRVGEAVTP